MSGASRQGGCLIEVGAAENTEIHADVPARGQQSDERSAQRAAVGRPDVPAAVCADPVLDFCRLLEHRGKFRPLRLGEAVVADAEDAKIGREQRDDLPEVALPVAAGAGQEQHGGLLRVSECIDLHRALLS